jgi:hypothetical protein
MGKFAEYLRIVLCFRCANSSRPQRASVAAGESARLINRYLVFRSTSFDAKTADLIMTKVKDGYSFELVPIEITPTNREAYFVVLQELSPRS